LYAASVAEDLEEFGRFHISEKSFSNMLLLFSTFSSNFFNSGSSESLSFALKKHLCKFLKFMGDVLLQPLYTAEATLSTTEGAQM
jgi:hypothetical protein